jgi:hypothetical protein
MMLIIQECCFIQSLHFSYELQEDFVQDSKQCTSDPLHQSGRHGIPSGRSSVKSIIHLDDEKFLSECPSMSKSFELFSVASIRISQQHVWTSFIVRQVKKISFQNTDMERQLQPSERRGYSVRKLSLTRQVVQKMFNRPDIRLHGPDVQALI